MAIKIKLLLCISILFWGCNELKRFKSASITTANSPNEYVSVSLFSAKTESAQSLTATKTVWDLHGYGQAAFIQKFSESTVNKDQLAEALNQTFLAENDNSPMDFTKKNIRIILSIKKNRDYSKQFEKYTPADRIDYFNMKLCIPEKANGYPKFTKWNKFETKFDTVKIADVTFERTIDANASAKAGNDNSQNSAGINFGVNNKKTTAQSLRYRYVSLNGALNPRFLQLEEEGNREIDLNDNIIIDAVIEFEQIQDNFVAFKNLFDDKSGRANPSDKTKVNILYFYMPDYPDQTSLKADIDFDYLFRHVVNGKLKTFPEYDDRIDLIQGKGYTHSVEIMSADEIKPKRWKIVFTDGKTTDVLHIFGQSANPLDVQFSNYYDASTFARWLATYPASSDNENLKINDLNFSIGNDPVTPLNKRYFKTHKMKVLIVPF